MEKILSRENMLSALKAVKRNKGAAGIDKITADELDEMAQRYENEQKQAYCERQEERYDRMSKYSLDPDNQRMYAARADEWGQRVKGFKKLNSVIDAPNTNVQNYKPVDVDENSSIEVERQKEQ